MQNMIHRPQRHGKGWIAQRSSYEYHALVPRRKDGTKKPHFLQKVMGYLHYHGSHSPAQNSLMSQREHTFYSKHSAKRASLRYLQSPWSFDRFL